MNRGELRAAVRTELLEPTAARWTDTQLNRYINDTLADLAAVTRATVRSVTVNVNAGVGTVALPATVLVPSAVYWVMNGNVEPLLWANPVVQVAPDTGTPRLVWLEGQMLRLYPIPDIAGGLYVVGSLNAPKLVSDNDTPVLHGVDDAIIAGTVWKAYQTDFDPQRDLWAQKYMFAKGVYIELELRRNPQQGQTRDIYEQQAQGFNWKLG